VNTNVLDRTILLLNDLPGSSVQAGLAPGQSEGETQVVLQSRNKPVVTGSVGLDRHGSVSTGEGRELIEVAINSPTGRGEQYTASLMHSLGTRFGRVGFSMPVGSDGVRAGINVSRVDYRVVEGPQAIANLNGQSSSASADISYPVIRTQQGNLYVSGSYTAKWFENFANQVVSRSYGTQVGAFSIMGNWFDNWFKRDASNQVSASASVGRLGFHDSLSQVNDEFGARTEGMYQKLNMSFARSQAIDDGWVLYTSASAQVASKNLDSSEKFYVGGASGVRAYPTSEGGGSTGELYQVELRKRFSNGVELRFFRDEGHVRQNIFPNPSVTSPNILRYGGGGIALIANLPNNITMSMAWSRRVGGNPNPLPNSSGELVDQDGTKRFDRFWLSASMTF
jgi:hemolysin activation/secretion protein